MHSSLPGMVVGVTVLQSVTVASMLSRLLHRTAFSVALTSDAPPAARLVTTVAGLL